MDQQLCQSLNLNSFKINPGPWNARYDPESDYILSDFTGALTTAILKEWFSAILKLSVKHNCDRVLNDLRQASLEKMSIVDLYGVKDIVEDVGYQLRFKRAIVIAGDHEKYRLYEIVSTNRGWTVKVFEDMVSARSWLGLPP